MSRNTDQPYDLVFDAARTVTPDGEAPCNVGVRDGEIVAVEPLGSLAGERHVRLRDDEVLLPGLVDTHVHVNEPGRTQWEGFRTATRAAAAGGVTTLLDMPLNSIPPTCDVPALQVKREAADGQCFVDVGFWGGAVPGNDRELPALHADGVFGFKCFLLPSGVDEFAPLDQTGLVRAMQVIGDLGSVLIVHAEDADVLADAPEAAGRSYADYVASRPPIAETRAIESVLDAARTTGVSVHIVHVSAAESLDLLDAARTDGVDVTAETCPHYLALAAEGVPDGATVFKCCPPVRDAANRERMWAGLASGALDYVVSDHSPCTPDLKLFESGDFGQAWGGIGSVQLGLPVVWTQARTRGSTLNDIAHWMSAGPARRVGLERKGAIAVGSDADLCVFAPDESFAVDDVRLYQSNPTTPYAGATLTGRVRETWLRGSRVDVEVGTTPEGQLLRRGER
ncbi:MAG: allantoinase AllB [Actinomycetia bacterium]|nr:allantoinase AllB [Actinomycetes bacterium]